MLYRLEVFDHLLALAQADDGLLPGLGHSGAAAHLALLAVLDLRPAFLISLLFAWRATSKQTSRFFSFSVVLFSVITGRRMI
jgi:phosphoglycerol transferase MdoB-like AlkP superfamily enzyme